MKKQRYLVAVSGGPDSMALLDMSRRKYYVEVAHVNHHKRDTAKRDEKIVRDYCRKYKIKFHKADLNPDKIKGNFQAESRNFRYNYFYSLCKKNKLSAVLVGHHKDDHIETYLMQLDKKLGVNHYGLDDFVLINGVYVKRPLLEYTKNDLLLYCKKHNIVYGIDESNLTNHYERNKLRHNVVEKMSDAKKDKLIKEIDKKNLIKLKHLVKALEYVNENDSYTIEEFNRIPYLNEYLRLLLPNKSDKYLNEIIRQINTSNSLKVECENYYIAKEYGKINIFLKPIDYLYTFKSIKEIKNKNYEDFKIRKTGNSFEGVTVSAKDFPITIRNYKNGDYIKLRYGTKKINRYFIDNKIALKERLSWPIVLNKDGLAILVPGIGCNIDHFSNNHTFFVIKL